MHLKFPYQIDGKGHTAPTGRSDYIRNLIRQVIFTAPGERVNRPNFGSGIYQLVFEPNSVELASTVQFLVEGSLHQWLGEVIEVNEVKIEVQDSTLSVDITYTEIGSESKQQATFQKSF